MDAILLFDKETKKIQSLIPGLDIDYFLNTQTVTVKSYAPIFDEEGREIGTREIEVFDPILKDYIKVKKSLDENLNYAIISTRTREELLEVEVPDYEYPSTPYNLIDKDGQVIDTIQLWIPPKIKTERKGFKPNGEMILEQKKKKALQGYTNITVLTEDEQNFDFSQHLEGEEDNKEINLSSLIFDLHENYIIENNSLVKVN